MKKKRKRKKMMKKKKKKMKKKMMKKKMMMMLGHVGLVLLVVVGNAETVGIVEHVVDSTPYSAFHVKVCLE
jgi:hypothetical protein